MRAVLLIMPVALVLASPAFAEAGATSSAPAVKMSKAAKRILKIMAERDGATCATGYKVRDVGQEYQIAAILGVKVDQQALIAGKPPCDLLTGVESKTGRERQIYFDISSLYPAF